MTTDTPFSNETDVKKNASTEPAINVEEEPIIMVGSPMVIVDGVSFSSGDHWTNWADTLSAQPERLFYPNTLQDLQVIIREANENKKKVRCVGSGHSWSRTAVTQDYMVSVNNMNKIADPVKAEDGSWTVTIEMGVQVEELDLFLRAHNPPLALAANVMPNDIRFGGILTMGCHGAGLEGRAISDSLTEITIVNSRGELRVYSESDDPEAFNAACINLGLLGIVYTATLKIQPMSDYRLRAIDTYPTVESLFSGPLAGQKLKEMVLQNDSTEMLYWPFATFLQPAQNDHIWLKQWKRTLDPAEDLSKYDTMPSTVDHPGFTALKVGEIVKEVPDAIHFDFTLGGKGRVDGKCLDASAGFKLDDDFGNFIEAFNDLMGSIYKFSTDQFPSKIGTVLEVRFIKASSKIMSFVYDTDPEAIYCMINLLAAGNTPEFDDYTRVIMSEWMEKYNAKPHWAKMWEQVPGVIPTLRREFKDRIVIFNRIRKSQDHVDMFVNETWEPFIAEHEV
ncbi:hypothetical protein FBU30_000647 [Linnemannia zychae]|nr:hypothetical protein FBU30_000647 [Linnemannia zychae]